MCRDGFLKALVCIGKMCHQEFQVPETSGKVWSKEDLPLVEEDQIREHVNELGRPWNLG